MTSPMHSVIETIKLNRLIIMVRDLVVFKPE
jgi:hypothetical protein